MHYAWFINALRFNCTAVIRAYFQSQPKQIDMCERGSCWEEVDEIRFNRLPRKEEPVWFDLALFGR